MTAEEKQLEVYSKGTRAWFSDDQEGWVVGTLTSKNVDSNKVSLSFYVEGRPKATSFNISEWTYNIT